MAMHWTFKVCGWGLQMGIAAQVNRHLDRLVFFLPTVYARRLVEAKVPDSVRRVYISFHNVHQHKRPGKLPMPHRLTVNRAQRPTEIVARGYILSIPESTFWPLLVKLHFHKYRAVAGTSRRAMRVPCMLCSNRSQCLLMCCTACLQRSSCAMYR